MVLGKIIKMITLFAGFTHLPTILASPFSTKSCELIASKRELSNSFMLNVGDFFSGGVAIAGRIDYGITYLHAEAKHTL